MLCCIAAILCESKYAGLKILCTNLIISTQHEVLQLRERFVETVSA